MGAIAAAATSLKTEVERLQQSNADKSQEIAKITACVTTKQQDIESLNQLLEETQAHLTMV